MRYRLDADRDRARSPERVEDLVKFIRDDQRRRWSIGDRILAEDFFHEYPNLLSHPDLVLDVIFAEFLLREERGEAPGVEEYAARFPEHADTIRMQVLLDRELSDGLRELGSVGPQDTERSAPSSLPGFEILGEIGRGGMGVAYRARQIGLNRFVCVKMIQAIGDTRPEHNERFLVEAEAIARLSHPNIVQIFEVGQHEGRPFLVLELINGGKLSQRAMGRPQAERTSAQWVETIARAVAYLHERGVIHRDLKPSNVLFATDGTPKLTDFGLAKLIDGDSHPTRTESLLGTPCYMAPEQARSNGTAIGPRSDIYSLGAILYELLTGRPPFQAETSWQTIEQVINVEPVPPRHLRPHLSRDLETICLKCLEKDPKRRYVTATDLAEDLRLFLAGQPIRARSVGHLEQLSKRIRRSPAIAVMSAAIVLIATTGFGTTLWHLHNANEARREVLLQAAQVKLQFDRAERQANIANAERKRAEANAEEANNLRKKAEHEVEHALVQEKKAVANLEAARQNLYESRVTRAYLEWANDNPYAGLRTLDECLENNRLTHHFGWEWFYLRQLFLRYNIFQIEGGDIWVTATQFSLDDRQLLSASGGNPFYETNGPPQGASVKVWEPGQYRKPKQILEGHSHLITGFAQHPRLPLIATGSLDDLVLLTNRNDGKIQFRAETRLGGIQHVSFDRFGDRIFAVGRSQIGVLDSRSGKFVDRFQAEPGIIHAAASTPDSEVLAYATRQPSAIHILAPNQRRKLRSLSAQEINSLALSPDGRLVAASTSDVSSLVRVWDIRSGQLIRELTFDGKINALAFSPDSRRLATGGSEPVIRVWDLATRALPTEFRGPNAPIRSISFSHDGLRVAAGLQKGDVMMFDVTSDPRSSAYPSSGYYLEALAFEPDGLSFLTAGANVGSPLKKWSIPRRNLEFVRDIDLHRDVLDFEYLAAFSRDGRRLIGIGGNRHDVKVWDTASGAALVVFKEHKLPVRTVAIHPGGGIALSSAWERSQDGTATLSESFLWEVPSGRILSRSLGGLPPIRAEFNPTQPILAVYTGDQIVRLRDTGDGHEIGEVGPRGLSVSGLAFSADGRILAVSEHRGAIRLHGMDRPGHELGQLRTSSGYHGMAFSPDNTRLAVAGLDKVEFFNAQTGQSLITLPRQGLRRPDEFMFHPKVVFSEDGDRILANQWDGTVNVWTAGLPSPKIMRTIPPKDLAIRDMNHHLREMLISARTGWWSSFRFHLWRYLLRPKFSEAAKPDGKKSVPMVPLKPAVAH